MFPIAQDDWLPLQWEGEWWWSCVAVTSPITETQISHFSQVHLALNEHELYVIEVDCFNIKRNMFREIKAFAATVPPTRC